MENINIVISNTTGADLFITGICGSDLSGVNVGQRVPNGASITVASWNSGSEPVDNWDFIFLGQAPGANQYQVYGANQYQVYMESTGVGKTYQSMGFYSESHNNNNSNPNPFTNDNCYLTA